MTEDKIHRITVKERLDRAIQWALDLNSSDSSRWPSPPSPEEVKWLGLRPGQYWDGPTNLVTVYVDRYGRPGSRQHDWDTSFWPFNPKNPKAVTLVAQIFHIDNVITVVLADDFVHLLDDQDQKEGQDD